MRAARTPLAVAVRKRTARASAAADGGETDPTPATHTRLWRGRRMLPMAMHGYQEEVDSTVPVGAATHEREPVGDTPPGERTAAIVCKAHGYCTKNSPH